MPGRGVRPSRRSGRCPGRGGARSDHARGARWTPRQPDPGRHSSPPDPRGPEPLRADPARARAARAWPRHGGRGAGRPEGARPGRVMSRTARRITAEDLAERIPARGAGDELDHLAETLNAMLVRLEAAFVQVRRFAADAAHELRTPLTALRGELEVGPPCRPVPRRVPARPPVGARERRAARPARGGSARAVPGFVRRPGAIRAGGPGGARPRARWTPARGWPRDAG